MSFFCSSSYVRGVSALGTFVSLDVLDLDELLLSLNLRLTYNYQQLFFPILNFVYLKITRRCKLCLPYNYQQLLVPTIIRIIRIISLSA